MESQYTRVKRKKIEMKRTSRLAVLEAKKNLSMVEAGEIIGLLLTELQEIEDEEAKLIRRMEYTDTVVRKRLMEYLELNYETLKKHRENKLAPSK